MTLTHGTVGWVLADTPRPGRAAGGHLRVRTPEVVVNTCILFEMAG